LWALSTVIFYFLHNRAQTHYLLEIALSLAVLIPLLVSRFRRYSPVSVVSANVVIISAITLWHGVITDPIGSAARVKWKVDRQVAEAIARSSDIEDRVLLFTNPVLYCLSNRLPASRFPFFTAVWKSPSMMREYRRATIDGLTAETTKVVVVHDSILQEMPEWLRSMVIEELTKNYRPLAFQSTDIYFGTTTVYVRHKPIALISVPVSLTGASHVPSSVDDGGGSFFSSTGTGTRGGLVGQYAYYIRTFGYELGPRLVGIPNIVLFALKREVGTMATAYLGTADVYGV
jgi:hypothetical protein